MANNNETTTKFKVDISDLKSAMQDARKQVALANSEFKAVSSGLDDWSKSADGVSAKQKQLSTNLNAQKSVLKEYEKILNEVKVKYGENSDEAREWQTKLNNQQAVVNRSEKELRNLDNALDDVGKSAKESGEGFTVFKGVLANLATQGINLALDGIKNLGKAMVGMVKESVNAYAEYEQLVGGVETLFKDSSDIVMKYANNAYKTAGMSANEYMSTVTSFSASLLNALGGDTKKSAEVADMAITDMSDNANKMGTSMEAIQNAYQGFAKGNYTMLDNLKLGYGGTKEEMKRLLADAQKLSGQKYDISNLNDIFQAIHVVQTELGITGTTAKEASTTIEGSVASMKSAWANLITGMADENANFDQLVTNLVDSVTTVISNILPVATKAIGGLGQLFTALAPIIATELPKLISDVLPTLLTSLGSLFEAVLQAVLTALPTITRTIVGFIPTIIDGIFSAVPQILSAITMLIYQIIDQILMMSPDLLQSAIEFFTGLAEALPEATDKVLALLLELVNDLIYGLIDATPDLVNGAMTFFNAIVEAFPQIIENIVTYLPWFISAIVDFLIKAVPQLIQGAITLFNALVQAIPQILPVLIGAIPTIINAIVSALITGLPILIQGAIQLYMALIDAIPVIITSLVGALPQIIDAITTTLLDNIPLLLDTAVQVFMALVQAIPHIVVALAQALPQIINTIMTTIFTLIPKLIVFVGSLIVKIAEWGAQLMAKGGEWALNFINKVIEFVRQLPEKVWTWLTNVITKIVQWGIDLAKKGKEAGQDLMDAIIKKVEEIPDKIKSIGSDIVKGLWNGINDMAGWIKDKITGFGEDVLGSLKDFFGINSPSKLMADEVGKWLPAGIAVGIDKNAKTAINSMKNLALDTVGATRDGLATATTTGGVTGGTVNYFYQTNNSPKALSRLEIYRQSKNLLGYAGGGY